MDNLTVGILGPVELRAGDAVVAVPQPGLRVLLAALAVSANRVVPASTLINLVWQEGPSRDREQNLHGRVYQLRRLLSQAEPGRGSSRLATVAPGYRLDLAASELDLARFRRMVADGRAEARTGSPAAAAEIFSAALGLWRGPALADVAALSPGLEAEAAGLEELQLSVTEDWASACLAAGRCHELVAELAILVKRHPLRDRMRGFLMTALYVSGRQADALETYRVGRTLLSEELGIEPGPELKALHEKILRGDPSLLQARSLAGRTREPVMLASHAGTADAEAAPRQLASPSGFSAGRDAEFVDLDEAGAVAAVGRHTVSTGAGLLERDHIVASAAELVDRVASGGAGALFLLGEAGLGKTSVIGQACRRAAEAGLTVGVGRGHPMESGLPFGVLVQALDELGGGGLLGVDAADSRAAAEWPARYYQVLRWLRDHAGDRVFLVIDDLHWADGDSVALVSFLCRRMDQVPFGLIASLRPWPAKAHHTADQLVHAGHGNVLRLLPLSEHAAGSLLQARLGRQVPAAERRQAFELSAGNPLLLEQLAITMGTDTSVPTAAGVSMAASGKGVLLSRFAGLEDSGMRCAQAAAVLGPGFLPAVAAEVARLEGAEADAAIEALARTRLIEQRTGAAAEFVHPLFRQALYDDMPGPVRCRLHARAFAALHARGLDAQAAEHAIQGDLSGDPNAVTVLEAAGRAARQAGAMTTAVSWLDKAVGMAGDQASVRLIMGQAEAQLVTGGAAAAASTCQKLLTRADVDARARLEIVWLLARAQATTGQHDVAAATFEHAVALAAGSDPATAVQVLLDAAYCAWLAGGAAPALALASRARDAAVTAGQAVRARADANWAEYAVICGDPDGIAAAQAAIASWGGAGNLARSIEETARRGGWGTANSLASCALGVEQLALADRAFSIVRAAAEDAGVPWAAAGLAVGHSYALFRMGRLEQALTAAKAAVSFSELVPLIDSYANAALAYMNLYVGRLDESTRLFQHAEAGATERGQLLAQMFVCDALGHRLLREGAITDACAAYDRLDGIRAQAGIQEPCLPAWPRHAMNAYLAAGRTGDAQRVLAWLDEITPRLPCTFPRIAAAAGRARLAELNHDYASAEALYQMALTLHSQTDLPIERCETLLAYGGFLRLAGQPARAQPVLAEAAHIAEQSGAHWLAGLAHNEQSQPPR